MRDTQTRLLALMRDGNSAIAKAASLVWALNSDLGLASLSTAACLGQACADALQQCLESLS